MNRKTERVLEQIIIVAVCLFVAFIATALIINGPFVI